MARRESYDPFVVVELDILHEGSPPAEAELVRLTWVVVDAETKAMQEGSAFVRGTALPDEFKERTGIEDAERQSGGDLSQAVAALDACVGDNGCLVALGSYRLEYLRSLAAVAQLDLRPHWSRYFDLGAEACALFGAYPSLAQLCEQAGVEAAAGPKVLAEVLVQFLAEPNAMAKRPVFLHPATLGNALDPTLAPPGLHPSDPRYGLLVKLRGLPWATTPNEVCSFLQDGTDLSITSDDVTLTIGKGARATGEAYVRLKTSEDCETAMGKHHAMLGPRYVEVLRGLEQEFEAYAMQARQIAASYRGVVRFRGLPWQVSQEDLCEFVNKVWPECSVDQVVIGVQPVDGRASGTAWCEFPSEELALRAVEELDRQMLGSRYIEAFQSSSVEMEAGRQAAAACPRRRGGPAKDRVKGKGWPRPVGHTGQHHVDAVLRLRGLPYTATEQEIVKLFNGFSMLSILPSTAPTNGRPSGEAYVEFSSADEAYRAFQQKNRSMVGPRYIELFFATKTEMMHAAAGNDAPTAAAMALGYLDTGQAVGQGKGYARSPKGAFYGDMSYGTHTGYDPQWSAHYYATRDLQARLMQEQNHAKGKGWQTPQPLPPQPPDRRSSVSVRGLPHDVTVNDLHAMFAGFPLAHSDSMELVAGKNGPEATVLFANPQIAAAAARERNGHSIRNQSTEVVWVDDSKIK